MPFLIVVLAAGLLIAGAPPWAWFTCCVVIAWWILEAY
jgi:hypothetical protein